MSEVTLGGDRLGSGNKQKVEMHNYHMSSFNQEQDFKSTLAPGILYPFIKLVGTNHGTFDIDLDSFVRTLPTNGPLFGSFKMQADIFCCPMRLYQGILHNNPVDIGLHMDRVYLPKIELTTIDGVGAPRVKGADDYDYQVNNSSLLKYLGISGIGTGSTTAGREPGPIQLIKRNFNATPILAYYDIFKNYYSNKQEPYAYVISPGNFSTVQQEFYEGEKRYGNNEIIQKLNAETRNWSTIFRVYQGNDFLNAYYKVKNLDLKYVTTNVYYILDGQEQSEEYEWSDIKNFIRYIVEEDKFTIDSINWQGLDEDTGENITKIKFNFYDVEDKVQADIVIKSFELKNIDKMRHLVLSKNELGDQIILGVTEGTNIEPYNTLTRVTTQDKITFNAFELNGLLLKTYQSDMFNNWLNSETIDLITQMTTMDTTNGFTMDDLNFMEKAYNVLTRIGINGGTYEDWQEAVYGEGAIRKAETPMYVGGMSSEIMFEEVIATSESKTDQYQALGSLAGKGTQVNKHGGNNIHIKCEEPCYIIGIVSITPRISYSQGNDWDMTDLDSLDDLHKPGFDGIGFQDLMIEQMAWWNTLVRDDGDVLQRNSAGKQTAWIQYQTAVDKVYGDFAKQNGKAFMVLNRNYEREPMTDANMSDEDKMEVLDLTTYIDPAKYNYAFAYTDLAAQNFWVQIHSKVTSRRKMAAQQIPNL